jgi:hypothetical protein
VLYDEKVLKRKSGWAELPDEILAAPISLGEHGVLGCRGRPELSILFPEFRPKSERAASQDAEDIDE